MSEKLQFKEAAAYLGIAPATLWKIVARSRRAANGYIVSGPTIKFFQMGKKAKIIFDRKDLNEFIAQHTVTPEDRAPLNASVTGQTTTAPLSLHEAFVKSQRRAPRRGAASQLIGCPHGSSVNALGIHGLDFRDGKADFFSKPSHCCKVGRIPIGDFDMPTSRHFFSNYAIEHGILRNTQLKQPRRATVCAGSPRHYVLLRQAGCQH